MAFSTDGLDFDTMLSRWADGLNHSLTEIDCNDKWDGLWSLLESGPKSSVEPFSMHRRAMGKKRGQPWPTSP